MSAAKEDLGRELFQTSNYGMKEAERRLVGTGMPRSMTSVNGRLTARRRGRVLRYRRKNLKR